MADYGDIIQSSFGRANPALPSVVGNIDEDPDRAQRAMDLAKATGVPGSVIFGDLDEFEKQNKAAMASGIVANNQYLADFVGSDPMVPKLANDDYGNLDAVSQKVTSLGLGQRIMNAFPTKGEVPPGFHEGFGDAPLGSWAYDGPGAEEHPLIARAVGAIGTPFELALRTVSGVMKSVTEEVKGGAEKLDPVLGKGFGQEIAGLVESEMMGLTGRHGVGPPMDPLTRARPWVENRREPPVGVLPEYDKLMTEQNATDLDGLKDATKEAQGSLLRDRNPGLFRQFIAQHTDAEIGISGEAVAALYREKLPAADDGLLGWAPGVAEKLELARETGSDVHIPLADWLANVDPKVMDALKDDIRVRPNGITKNEAMRATEIEAQAPAAEPLDGEVPQARAATALEPMLSIGDRKLTLERLDAKVAPGDQTIRERFGPEQGFHDFSINDEKGNPVGTINLSEIKDGKELYVEMINGINGLGPRDFGPRLMWSLKQQLRAEFPKAEWLVGHRVSGMRERMGTYDAPSAQVRVRLDAPDVGVTHDIFRRVLEGGKWETYSPNTQAYIKPRIDRPVVDREIIDAVSRELGRIVPNKLNVRAADRIESTGASGQGGETIEPGGIYIRYRDAYPIILYSLDHGDSLGSARHEAIHHLRNYGFFKPEEWATLEQASKDNGWVDRFGIDRRYPEGDPGLKLEESIADAYKAWEAGVKAPTAEIHGVFEKMKAFFAALRKRLGELLGKDPTWEDIFQKVSTGEVGLREGTEPLDARAFNEQASVADPSQPTRYERDIEEFQRKNNLTPNTPEQMFKAMRSRVQQMERERRQTQRIEGERYSPNAELAELRGRLNYLTRQNALVEKLSVPEEPQGGSRIFERAAALGMTVDQFRRYDELMQQRHAEDITEATRRATDEKAREYTKEWKENRKALRQEVSESIRNRPDVAADLFFGSGELYGKKVPLASVKLDEAALTPEQKAALPKQYYGPKGLHPDDVANLFGYGSGDAMLSHLIVYNEAKLTAGMSAKDFVSRVTDVETDRQMQQRHGVLENNIMDAVNEQVTGETQQNLLHEETLQLGLKSGKTILDKATILQQLRDQFAKMPLGSVSSAAYMRAAGKAGREAEFGLLDNDPEAAFRAKQQQYYATVIASEATKLEKEVGKFNKVVKSYSRPFDPKTSRVDPQFSLYIRNVLSKVELPYGMSVQWMEKAISEASSKSLAEFVKQVNETYAISGVDLPVADALMKEDFHKPLNDLTVDEFRAVRDSIVSMDKFGKDVEKVNVAGARQDRKDFIKAGGIQLAKKFEPQDFGATGKPGPIRTYFAALMNMETLFGRFDGRDPQGLFTRMFIYPGMAAADAKDVLVKEYSKGLQEAGVIKDANKKLDSPLIDPRTGKPLTNFTRENLATIISNMGNDYNWRTMTKGWKVDPDILWKWVEANSTVEDLDRAQAVGKLFNKGKASSDIVYGHLYGVAPENIQVRPFTMHGKQYDGWYHPIIRDPIRSKIGIQQTPDPADGTRGTYWPSPSNSYTKRRTGAIDVISLSQEMVPIKLNQMLHDIAFREFVHNSAKVIRDPKFRSDVSTYYGPEYVGTLDTWLERIAGNASYRSDAIAMATRISNQIRGNVISTYIAFSPTTIEKHGFTAAVMSAREVGASKFTRAFAEVGASSFYHAVMDLFGRGDQLGDSIWQFARKNSETIQARDRNFLDTLGGQMDLTLGKTTLRQKIIQLGSKGVAFSDMLSAVPTWWAKYQDVMGETGSVEHATYEANRAVRRAHGSTSIVNQPTIVSHTNPLSPWLTSIYGFFGTNMQRRFEIAHDLNDAYKLAKGGEIKQAAAMAPSTFANIMTYVVWPGLVEEAVTSQFFDDKKKGGLIGHALAFSLGTAASTFIGIRDLAYGLTHGTDPQTGLLSSPLHDVSQLLRDVKKDRPLNKQKAGKLVEDAITVFGDATGMGPKHVGTAAHYGIDVLTREQRPKGLGDVYRGVITGHQQKREVR